ncbi:hypothetical protein F5Y18DRAFT_303289 [Xylariaceae sp. FL1019]|nr:hypothetical protein F5Y18DRAFT_303289 [Xylariaceae sp. FL1019]
MQQASCYDAVLCVRARAYRRRRVGARLALSRCALVQRQRWHVVVLMCATTLYAVGAVLGTLPGLVDLVVSSVLLASQLSLVRKRGSEYNLREGRHDRERHTHRERDRGGIKRSQHASNQGGTSSEDKKRRPRRESAAALDSARQEGGKSDGFVTKRCGSM